MCLVSLSVMGTAVPSVVSAAVVTAVSRGGVMSVIPVRAYPVPLIGPVALAVPVVVSSAVFVIRTVRVSPGTGPFGAKCKAASRGG